MPKDMVIFGIYTGKRQNYTVHESFSDTADFLGEQFIDGIGLLKISMICVQENGLIIWQGSLEYQFETVIPSFKKNGGFIDAACSEV